MGNRTEFPDAGIRRVMHGEGALAYRLQLLEFPQAGPFHEARIEETLRNAQDNLTIDIMLDVLSRLVADTDWPHAAIAGKLPGKILCQVRFQPNPVNRLDMAAFRLSHDVPHPAHIVLQRPHAGQPVQRGDREIRVPDPAIAVVPVPLRAFMFRDGGREGRDDAAGFLVDAELQRNRGTDHGLLPFKRHCQAAGPTLPVEAGPLFPVARNDLRMIGQGFVRSQNESSLPVQNEAGPRQDIGDRRIRGDAEGKFLIHEADMVDAPDRLQLAPAPVGFRGQRDPHPRRARQNPEPAHQRRRTEHPPLILEPRGKIDDFHDGAITGFEARPQDGAVVVVGLGARDEVFHPDGKGTAAAQKLVEHRLAIEPRQAGPLIIAT